MVYFTKDKMIIEIETGQCPIAELQDYKNALMGVLTMMDSRLHSEYKDLCIQRLTWLLSALEFNENQVAALERSLFYPGEYDILSGAFLFESH